MTLGIPAFESEAISEENGAFHDIGFDAKLPRFWPISLEFWHLTGGIRHWDWKIIIGAAICPKNVSFYAFLWKNIDGECTEGVRTIDVGKNQNSSYIKFPVLCTMYARMTGRLRNGRTQMAKLTRDVYFNRKKTFRSAISAVKNPGRSGNRKQRYFFIWPHQ